MDYKDYQCGMNENSFWLKGKRGLIDVLFKFLKSNKNLKILNVGAGTGEDLDVIGKNGEVYAIDIDEKALSLISEKKVVEKKLGDICKIPYEDNHFDVVVAFDVLEHVENDYKAVMEIKRVLNDSGVFIFTVPAFQFLYSKHDKDLNHFRRYNKKSIKKLLNNFDFLYSGYWLFLFFLFLVVQKLFLSFLNLSKLTKASLPRFVDNFLYKTLNFENWLISKKIKFPIGLTFYGMCKTKSKI